MMCALKYLALVLPLAACMPGAEEVTRNDYADFCASCHGDSGRGDGAFAAGLSRKPADLTRIAARNGGEFPLAQVMSKIDGYARDGHADRVMPEFGQILEGETVLFDSGDGVATPTPGRLVDLALYLKSIQRD